MRLSTLLLALPLAAHARKARRSELTDCLIAAAAPIVLPSDAGWADETVPYNLRFAPTPSAVVVPRTQAEVQSAVGCASAANVRVSVKSGGHSYGAYGLAGALVINMAEFQAVTLDKTTQIATVGAGVRVGNLAMKLFQLGGRAIPHGTCPGIGIGGHATLGGFGLDSRLWGLMVDAVTTVTAVLANGTAVTASATENSDLFWALRGAGPGFAVVTSFQFRTYAAPAASINWSYTYSFPTARAAARAFLIAQTWGQQSARKELGYGILLFPGKGFLVRGVYHGARESFDALIAPLLTLLKDAHAGVEPAKSIKTLGWIESLTELAGSNLTTPAKGYSLHESFYAKSLVTKERAPLSPPALTALLEHLYAVSPTAPGGSSWLVIANLYGGPGSAINAVAVGTSSYAHRDAGYVIQFYVRATPFDEAIVALAKGMVDALGAEAADLPAYAPYADPELGRTQAQTRYWGEGVARLRAIKARVDPRGVLYNPQGF